MLGLAVLAVAGCRHTTHSATKPPQADEGLLEQAYTTEKDIIAAYDNAIAAATGDTTALMSERDAHATHLAALDLSISVQPTRAILTMRQLPAFLTESVDALRSAAVSATDGNHAAVFASIAAAHQVSGHE